MSTRNALLAVTALVVGGFIYSAVLYPHLPEMIPIHWGIDGKVDGWGHKSWAAWVMPGSAALLTALLFALPYLSPRGFSVEAFRETFNYAVVAVTGMFTYIHVLMLQAALHPELDTARYLVAGVFLVLAVVGNVLGKTQRNFWFGVRTPWTLANDQVWLASNRLAGRVMVAAGLIGAAAVWKGAPALICFVGLMLALMVPIVHSALYYKELEREGRLDEDA